MNSLIVLVSSLIISVSEKYFFFPFSKNLLPHCIWVYYTDVSNQVYQNISLPNILLKHKNYNELMVLRKSRHRRSYKNNLIPRPSLVAQVVKTLQCRKPELDP